MKISVYIIIIILLFVLVWRTQYIAKSAEHYDICGNCQGWISPAECTTGDDGKTICKPVINNPYMIPAAVADAPQSYSDIMTQFSDNNMYIEREWYNDPYAKKAINDNKLAELKLPDNISGLFNITEPDQEYRL